MNKLIPTPRPAQFSTVSRFILVISVVYTLAYLAYPALPGNNQQFPLGWWGWFDQGKYLMSANAFAHWDLSPDKHFYPPLYPLLGAPFVRWWAMHPFFVIDFISFLWFAYTFIVIAQRYVSLWVACGLFAASIVLAFKIFSEFIIPWTSTISVALISSGIYVLHRVDLRLSNTHCSVRGLSLATSFIFAASLGLLVPLRPLDAIWALPIGIAYLGLIWVRSGNSGFGQWREKSAHTLTALVGGALGGVLFIVFNFKIYDSVLGGYFKVAAKNGYFLSDLPEKFVSLFADSFSLYLEPHASLIDHYPWLVISLLGVVYGLLRGDLLLRVLAVCIILQVILYFPYGDLLPNGMWRYNNIHYFKWAFPYLALLAFIYCRFVWEKWHSNKRAAGIITAFTVLGVVIILSLRIQLSYWPATIDLKSEGKTHIAQIMLDKPRVIDTVDVIGEFGGFNEVYFGHHQLWVDDKEFAKVRDFRMVPAPWGIRILFIRPVMARSIKIKFASELNIHDLASVVRVGEYHFHLGMPKPFWEEVDALPPSPYRVGDIIDFSNKGTSTRYCIAGWSGAEGWGRWTDGTKATLRLWIVNGDYRSLGLMLYSGGYVNGKHLSEQVDIKVNGTIIDHMTFREVDGDAKPHRHLFAIPEDVLRSDHILRVTFIIHQPASPQQLNLGDDSRNLGVGVVSMQVVEIGNDSLH